MPTCSVCGGPIQAHGTWIDGHNAQPINDGRCCDNCNNTKVLPARLAYARQDRDPHTGTPLRSHLKGEAKKFTKDWLGSGATLENFLGDWAYNVGANGKTRPVSPATVARDLSWLAKERYAREAQESKPAPDELNPAEKAKAYDEIDAWLDTPRILERAQHSIAWRVLPEDLPFETHVLLIQHDWAKLLANSIVSGPGHEIHFPYPVTVFEFSFRGGVRVVALCMEVKGEPGCKLILKTPSSWAKLQTNISILDTDEKLAGQALAGAPKRAKQMFELIKFIVNTVKAVCAMLEAEVAETTPMREPYKSNRPRDNGLPLPKISHHLVSLAERHRTAPAPAGGHHRSPRLHFRRGHWRHYTNHRTWIKWTLVGNPDLGFIDKEYRL